MREIKSFGKRQENHRNLPSDKVIQETFAVVNNGCDSQQVVDFLKITAPDDVEKFFNEGGCSDIYHVVK